MLHSEEVRFDLTNISGISRTVIGALAALLLSVGAADAVAAKRIKVTGEIFDT